MKQTIHNILPLPNHDELARQNFVTSMKSYIARQINPGNKTIYEKRLKPQFIEQHHREPQTRHEIRPLITKESYYRWWSILRRLNQELLWDCVNDSISRQLTTLTEKTQITNPLGTLTLNPNLPIPKYHQAVDIHCMPGGYHTESVPNDITAGALYDRGVFLYGLGWLGPDNDDVGQSVIESFLKIKYPTWQPTTILDIGCSVGHSTLPYVDAYPNAELYAIDIGPAMLRYAHARAESMGKKVHFQQQNAEQLNFPNESFDLVLSHIFLHEIPRFALKNVFQECYRILKPGGMMIHAEGLLYKDLDPYNQLMYDWETANNNEPFWSSTRDLDLIEYGIQAGFKSENLFYDQAANGIWKLKLAPNSAGGIGRRGSWLIFGGHK